VRRALLAAALGAIVWAAPSGAIVPPKDCGRVGVSGKRYNVKADQLPCPTAVRYTKTYLRSHRSPRRYSCHRFSGTALVFRCVNSRANPDRTFFAIRR
jgi:hypothetical protein